MRDHRSELARGPGAAREPVELEAQRFVNVAMPAPENQALRHPPPGHGGAIDIPA
jgi:hypothetical protein